MKRASRCIFAITAVLLLIVLSGCDRLKATPTATATATPTPGVTGTPSPTPSKTNQIVKPKPVVLDSTAGTGGLGDSYYAIIDATVRNDGADGTVNVVTTVVQGTVTQRNEFPVFLKRGDKQVVRSVFHLKWKGGEFTPNVTVEVP